MAENICKVAVNVALYAIDKLYDYKIPPKVRVEPGMRVLVPFGRGNVETEGVVLKTEHRQDTNGLKALRLVLDEEPVLDEFMLRLAAHMRERLFCTFFDSVKAMLPAGLWFAVREAYTLTGTAEGVFSPEEAAIVGLFSGKGQSLLVRDMMLALGNQPLTRPLQALCRNGVLRKESSIRQKARDKTVKLYALNMPLEEAASRAEKGRSHVRIDVVSTLNSEGDMTGRELSYMTGASNSVLATMEKNGILRSYRKEVFRTPDYSMVPPGPPIHLTTEQKTVCDGLCGLLHAQTPAAALLFGVTGSGKTQVYIKLIQAARKAGKGAIVLVPEIGLTPQFIEKFVSYFGTEVAVLHSGLSVGERYDNWKKIKTGAAQVVVGTRSAVFAPVRELGVIILDEEQDDAYKSDCTPRYHARDVAKYRAVQNRCLVLLGSATPSVESYYGAKMGKYSLFTLKERYIGSRLPAVTVADMRGILRDGYGGLIGPVLQEQLRDNLDAGKQSILFLNRRGHSKKVGCAVCGWTPECEKCSVSMTYHSVSGRLMCHYCGASAKLPAVCPQCGSRHILTEVPGTQRVEEELNDLFPSIRILRMDADALTGKHSHETLFAQFSNGKADVLLGTQMVTKGLDFENVTLVGVLDADQALYTQDYRAREKTFSLLTQVVGRAGRRFTPGRAVIQTYSPENDTILLAARQDYEAFYAREIVRRQALLYPPAAQILVLTAGGEIEHQVLSCLMRLKRRMESLMAGQFSDYSYPVLGPAPAGILKLKGRYRYHLSVRCPESKRRRELVGGLLREFSADRENRGVTLYADINPQDL